MDLINNGPGVSSVYDTYQVQWKWPIVPTA